MKDAVMYAAMVFFAVVGLAVVIFIGVRFKAEINTTGASLQVQEVEPGVRCATLVTSEGAAIDCWRTNE